MARYYDMHFRVHSDYFLLDLWEILVNCGIADWQDIGTESGVPLRKTITVRMRDNTPRGMVFWPLYVEDLTFDDIEKFKEALVKFGLISGKVEIRRDDFFGLHIYFKDPADKENVDRLMKLYNLEKLPDVEIEKPETGRYVFI